MPKSSTQKNVDVPRIWNRPLCGRLGLNVVFVVTVRVTSPSGLAFGVDVRVVTVLVTSGAGSGVEVCVVTVLVTVGGGAGSGVNVRVVTVLVTSCPRLTVEPANSRAGTRSRGRNCVAGFIKGFLSFGWSHCPGHQDGLRVARGAGFREGSSSAVRRRPTR
jgi:hypothetical protein